ncbi:MAG: hypothetical protein ABJA82_00565 [Myxococcales bacterium]
MSSIGLTRSGSGAGVLPVLQRAWGLAVEVDLQAHENKLDVLAGIATGTASALAASLRWPVRIVVASLVLLAASSAVMAAVQVAELFRPIVEVIR